MHEEPLRDVYHRDVDGDVPVIREIQDLVARCNR
jgi:hypothetical protein